MKIEISSISFHPSVSPPIIKVTCGVLGDSASNDLSIDVELTAENYKGMTVLELEQLAAQKIFSLFKIPR